jgi:hypothetical protein
MKNLTLSLLGLFFWFITFYTGNVISAFLFGSCYGIILKDILKDTLNERS